MPIGDDANQKDKSRQLDPVAEAQRNLVANGATDPKELLSEDADPVLVKEPNDSAPSLKPIEQNG